MNTQQGGPILGYWKVLPAPRKDGHLTHWLLLTLDEHARGTLGSEDDALAVYRAIADRTGGALLDFRASRLQVMGEVLAGVATLAIGGRNLPEAQNTAGARLLLEHLPSSAARRPESPN